MNRGLYRVCLEKLVLMLGCCLVYSGVPRAEQPRPESFAGMGISPSAVVCTIDAATDGSPSASVHAEMR
jgi:hypothetical protein